jgi:hypothetical protein
MTGTFGLILSIFKMKVGTFNLILPAFSLKVSGIKRKPPSDPSNTRDLQFKGRCNQIDPIDRSVHGQDRQIDDRVDQTETRELPIEGGDLRIEGRPYSSGAGRT